MNLVKTTLTFDDGSVQEFEAASTPVEPTQTVTITAGQTVEVIAQ